MNANKLVPNVKFTDEQVEAFKAEVRMLMNIQKLKSEEAINHGYNRKKTNR
jgi:hypothetical protein